MQLNLSSFYHPHSNSQTEVLNRCLETYLRCYYNEDALGWFFCLSIFEYWYNASYRSTIHTTPYEALYRRTSQLHNPELPSESTLVEVDNSLMKREINLQILKNHLLRDQHRMMQ